MNDNSTLFLYLNLFVSLAFALFEISIGATLANSDLLIADGSFMLVDALTYALNIWADAQKRCKRTPRGTSLRDLYASAFSVAALYVTTLATAAESAMILATEEKATEKKTVDWEWVMWIGVANLMLDIAAWTVFILGLGTDDDDENKKKIGINLYSALLHLGRDTATTVLVLGTGVAFKIMQSEDGSSKKIDCATTITLDACVLLGAIGLTMRINKERVVYKKLYKQ